MKILNILFLLTSFIVLTSFVSASDNLNNNIKVENNVVFDGKEGNMYFFTDMNQSALTIEDDEDQLNHLFQSDPNSYIGNIYRLTLKIESSETSNYKADSVIELKLIEQNFEGVDLVGN